MKAIVALLLVFALANASYSSKYPLDFTKRRSMMQVMVEVENRLKNGGPIETINNVLAGFKEAVNQEQVNHDDVYSAQKAEFDAEIAYRQTEVSDANDTLRTANQQIGTATRLRAKAQSQLAAASENLIQNRQHLVIINDVIRDET
jgi:hypothetical protein